MAHIGSQSAKVRAVVINIFLLNLDLLIDGGVPLSLASDCETILSGRTTNNIKNQITANNTKAAEIVILFTSDFF